MFLRFPLSHLTSTGKMRLFQRHGKPLPPQLELEMILTWRLIGVMKTNATEEAEYLQLCVLENMCLGVVQIIGPSLYIQSAFPLRAEDKRSDRKNRKDLSNFPCGKN